MKKIFKYDGTQTIKYYFNHVGNLIEAECIDLKKGNIYFVECFENGIAYNSFNLTSVFGEGNEPKSVEEVERVLPLGIYEKKIRS